MGNDDEKTFEPGEVRFVLPRGFTEEQVRADEYCAPLAEAARPMAEHCERLLAAISSPGFDGARALDCTANDAELLIWRFFETLAFYEQGRVPYHAADRLVELTGRLLEAELAAYPQCAVEIAEMGHAFRHSHALWRIPLAQPTMPRRAYLKQLFASRRAILAAICAFDLKLVHAPAPAAKREDLADLVRRKAEEIKGHVSAETAREIAAKAPRRKRRYGHEGNGLKGPKTKTMQKQRRVFEEFLETHPVDAAHSRSARAHACWLRHPEWEKAKSATGEAKGYSGHKTLARA